MSRIFDALRKSKKQLQGKSFIAPDTFLETMEKAHSGLDQVLAEQACIRPESRLVVYSEPQSLGAERFRFLQTRLGRWHAAKKIKTILITSALPQEGKSLAALNLATVLAGQQGHKVLLLEGDLRRSDLRSMLGLGAGLGLSECLRDGSDPLAAVRRIEPLGFYLLSSGQTSPNPVELLQSQRFSDLLGTLISYFDWILIDSPPVSPLADTELLRVHADGTLLVVRAGATPREAIEEALRLLGPENVLGIVLNGAEGLNRAYYQYDRRNGSGGHEKARKKKGQGPPP